MPTPRTGGRGVTAGAGAYDPVTNLALQRESFSFILIGRFCLAFGGFLSPSVLHHDRSVPSPAVRSSRCRQASGARRARRQPPRHPGALAAQDTRLVRPVGRGDGADLRRLGHLAEPPGSDEAASGAAEDHLADRPVRSRARHTRRHGRVAATGAGPAGGATTRAGQAGPAGAVGRARRQERQERSTPRRLRRQAADAARAMDLRFRRRRHADPGGVLGRQPLGQRAPDRQRPPRHADQPAPGPGHDGAVAPAGRYAGRVPDLPVAVGPGAVGADHQAAHRRLDDLRARQPAGHRAGGGPAGAGAAGRVRPARRAATAAPAQGRHRPAGRPRVPSTAPARATDAAPCPASPAARRPHRTPP